MKRRYGEGVLLRKGKNPLTCHPFQRRGGAQSFRLLEAVPSLVSILYMLLKGTTSVQSPQWRRAQLQSRPHLDSASALIHSLFQSQYLIIWHFNLFYLFK